MNSISPRLFWQLLQTKEIELDASMLRFTNRGKLELNTNQYARCQSCHNLLINGIRLVTNTSETKPTTCHTCEFDRVMMTTETRLAEWDV